MKNIILSFATLITVFSTNAQSLTKQNVGKLITYSNSVVEYYNHHIQYMNDISAYTVGALETYKSQAFGGTLYNPADMHDNPIYENSANPFTYSPLLLPAEKQALQSNLTNWETSFKAAREAYKKLYTYDEAQEYDKDKGKKGIELCEQILVLLEKMESPAIATSSALDDLSNRSFAISVQGKPLEKYYIAMYNDLNLHEKLLKAIKTFELGKSNYDLVQAAFKKIEQSHNKNVELPRPILQKYDAETGFINFYDVSKQILTYFDENVGYYTKEKTISKTDFDKEMLSYYNALVEAYNGFND